MQQPKYQRCILKISGESLAGKIGYGLDQTMIDNIAAQVVEINRLGVELAIVVGGGNIWRGRSGAADGMDRSTADYMGMLATVINALALADAIEQAGAVCRVQSAIAMHEICESYVRLKALHHLEKGRIVIFAGGSGNPYFSTDTAAALRAAEIHADVILMAKKVDGVYDADPVKNPQAKRFSHLSYSDVLSKELQVMDSTAASLCRDNHIPLIVFNIMEDGNMMRAVLGENIGTTLA